MNNYNIYYRSSLDERVEEAMHAFCFALAGDNDDEEGNEESEVAE